MTNDHSGQTFELAPDSDVDVSWGQRWSAILDEAGPAHARRVQRGGALARRGLVEDLDIAPGIIRATVREDRYGPCPVELRWAVPDDQGWDAATEALAREVRFTVSLLDGELRAGLDAVLAEAGVQLLPQPDDLDHRCGCHERSRWCQHVAAVYVAVGARLARDPVQLLTFRGRSRDELLRAVRAERRPDGHLPKVQLDLSHGFTAARGPLDEIALHPAPVEDPAGLLLRLGEPPGVDDVEPLLRLVERAAEGAWRLAAGEGAAAADEEVLLAELRARRVTSAAALAEALGRDPADVTDQLQLLFEQGQVLRTGSGDRARYRAADA